MYLNFFLNMDKISGILFRLFNGLNQGLLQRYNVHAGIPCQISRFTVKNSLEYRKAAWNNWYTGKIYGIRYLYAAKPYSIWIPSRSPPPPSKTLRTLMKMCIFIIRNTFIVLIYSEFTFEILYII